MLKTLKDQAKPLITKFAPARNFLIARQFGVELELLKGTHKNTNQHPSVLHFSVNKSATQYVKSVIRQCSSANGLVNVGMNEYAFKSDFPYLNKLSAEEMQQYHHVFKPQGYTYSVFGGMIDGIPNLDQYLVVLMVRDPRDVLVSGYYSVAYSHPEPAYGTEKYKNFLNDRAFAQQATVDEYAIAQCDRVYATYERYRTLLLNRHPNAYITKYEDMVSDFGSWLQSVADYCQFELSDNLRNQLIEENEKLRPKSEDVKKHIRKGKAGDYKEKLKPETVDHIESKLSTLLTAFGYT